MKISKRIVLLMALLLIVAFAAGCGGGEESADDQGQEQSPAGETVKIGLNYELSGPVATYGGNGVNGIELAIKEINESGGVLDGVLIEPIKVDNKSGL